MSSRDHKPHIIRFAEMFGTCPLFSTLFETRFRDTSGDRSGRFHPSLTGRPPGAPPFSLRAGTPPTSARSLLRSPDRARPSGGGASSIESER